MDGWKKLQNNMEYCFRYQRSVARNFRKEMCQCRLDHLKGKANPITNVMGKSLRPIMKPVKENDTW